MADIAYYVAQANEQAAHDRHGLRVQTYAAGLDARAYVLLGRYKPKAKLYWEQSPTTGRRHYFTEKAHTIFAAVLADIDAGAKLSVTGLARLTRSSRSYVSKTISLLRRFGFIEVVSSERGRFGGIIARIASRLRSMFPSATNREETLTPQRPRKTPKYIEWRIGHPNRTAFDTEMEALGW